jgi:ABC-type uncharacterized transport system ATPase subunit
MTAIPVEAAGIGKRFGNFAALDEVSFRVASGTVHALLGENGAGKSTLVKCLLGYYRADAGSFLVDGREAEIARPADADRLGLGMVYQHFTLVPSMTVAENLVMARGDVPGVIPWVRERAALDAFMAGMPFRLPLDARAGTLAAGQRQKAEILKQLYLRRRFLVLDEPTSVLTPQEADEMLTVMRGLAQAGQVTVVIITHKLREVARFADAVTVLRRGRVAGGGPVASLPADALTRMMIGESHRPAQPERHGAPEPEPRLRVTGLRVADDRGGTGLDVARLAVHAREIVGVAGVSGNGQRELVEVLGGQRAAEAGEVLVEGVPYAATRAEAQARGVRVLPEEPLRNGCVPRMSVADNLNLRGFDRDEAGRRRPWLDRRAMAERAARLVLAYGVRAPSAAAPIEALSGGNVQRCVLARELDGDVRLLIVANPCFGLDVRAAAEVRARIVAARNAGAAVLLVSEDLDELLDLADRIVVMREGQIVHEAANNGAFSGASAQEIGGHMVGSHMASNR